MSAQNQKARWWQRSVFWRMAILLVGVQVLTGLIAILLSGYFALDQSYEWVRTSLHLRLDDVAREIENRASFDENGSLALPTTLRYDLLARFPDPLYILKPSGEVWTSLWQETTLEDSLREGFEVVEDSSIAIIPQNTNVPVEALAYLSSEQMAINFERGFFNQRSSWGIAPIYNQYDELVAGLLVQPLSQSINNELSGTRDAFLQALFVVLGFGTLIAFFLGGLLTWRLVKPLQLMTYQVEAIGAGNYENRIERTGYDELGRLSEAINQMADDVAQSVETLTAADKLRRELVANVGHDLRTPLAAMQGYLEEAERFIQDNNISDAIEALDATQKQSKYLQRLTEDLFELSLFDSGHPPLRLEPIPIAELLHESVRRHRKTFDSYNITLTLNIEPQIPLLEADGLRLLRVLDNLLSNAYKHTVPGDTVSIRAFTNNEMLIIEIEDTGEGMLPEVLERVFERYYKGNTPRTRTQSTGLGLAISKAIIEAHQGSLVATSEYGKGSCFRISLPFDKHLS